MNEADCAAEPDVTMLMASIIRLMALEHTGTCAERRATLTRLLNYLAKHPAVRRSPHVAAPIDAAIATRNHKLMQEEFTAVVLMLRAGLSTSELAARNAAEIRLSAAPRR